MPATNTVLTTSIRGLGAVTAVASAIEGVGPHEKFRLTSEHGSVPVATNAVRGNQAYTSLRFFAEETQEWASAEITIERPERRYGDVLYPATVTWSSASSGAWGTHAAVLTAELLGFAAQVADQLNEWASAGALPRLNDNN